MDDTSAPTTPSQISDHGEASGLTDTELQRLHELFDRRRYHQLKPAEDRELQDLVEACGRARHLAAATEHARRRGVTLAVVEAEMEAAVAELQVWAAEIERDPSRLDGVLERYRADRAAHNLR